MQIFWHAANDTMIKQADKCSQPVHKEHLAAWLHISGISPQALLDCITEGNKRESCLQLLWSKKQNPKLRRESM